MTDRLSPYEELIAIVQCDGANLANSFETIAAFNSVQIAQSYRDRCATGRTDRNYRVMVRAEGSASNFDGWRVI